MGEDEVVVVVGVVGYVVVQKSSPALVPFPNQPLMVEPEDKRPGG